MSVLSYNGVTLPYNYSTQFNQEFVLDPSNTDVVYTKFDIVSDCVINTDYLSLIAPDLVQAGQPITANPADIMNIIRTRLRQKRRPLSFKVNGVEMIPPPQNSQGIPIQGTVDAFNGPEPMYVNIKELNNTTFLLSFRVTGSYWENYTPNNASPLVTENKEGNVCISNRWTETIDLDNRQFSTRTREGTAVIRSDNTGRDIFNSLVGYVADDIRSTMAVVAVPNGCVRQRASYTVSPDGLSLRYSIVDREVYCMPPIIGLGAFPVLTGGFVPVTMKAYEADGEYVEQGGVGGARIIAMCRVRLKGAKTTPKVNLLTAAVAIVNNKLRVNQTPPSNSTLLTNPVLHTRLWSNLYDNEVEFQASCQISEVNKSFNASGVIARIPVLGGFVTAAGLGLNVIFGTTFGVDPTNTPAGTPPVRQTGFNYNAIASLPMGSESDKVIPPQWNPRGNANAPFLLQAAAYFDPSVLTVINKATGQFNPSGTLVGQAGVNKEP